MSLSRDLPIAADAGRAGSCGSFLSDRASVGSASVGLSSYWLYFHP